LTDEVVEASDDSHAKLADYFVTYELSDAVKVMRRLDSRSKGLEDIVVCTSSICFIDGEEGRLLYRGYDIRDLAAESTFEETTYLLWNSKLPTEAELRAFSYGLARMRALPKELISVLQALPENSDVMDAVRVGVAALGILDDPLYTKVEKAMSIAAKMGTIVATVYRHSQGLEPIPPREDLSTAANFLYMISGKEPSAQDTRLMDILLILHADHELNASTFTARVITSTLSDMHSAITGAVGALKGPLHGGANEQVVQMLNEITSPEKAEAYIFNRLANKEKIMGFGHRVYKSTDPRAQILKELETHFVQTDKEKKELEMLQLIVDVVKKEKNLHPNVDLYSGVALQHLGVPSRLFTPVFVMGRAPGWLAHVLEQYADNRIIRPRAEYIGPQRMIYFPIDRRIARTLAVSEKETFWKDFASMADYFSPGVIALQKDLGIGTKEMFNAIGYLFGKRAAALHSSETLDELLQEMVVLWEKKKAGSLIIESKNPLVLTISDCRVCGQLAGTRDMYECSFHEGFFRGLLGEKLGKDVNLSQRTNYEGETATWCRRFETNVRV
jgi:citrate synthase